MNELKVFENEQFGKIRTINENSTVLFCGSDIARALGYARPNEAVLAHCKGTVKRRTLTVKGEQEMSFIPEGDVYRLIARSKLPSAEQFERWVFDEVLPSIRKHGGYLTPEKVEEALLNPDVLIRLATELKQERTARLEAEQSKKLLTDKIERDRPFTQFGSAIAANSDAILVGEFAKLACNSGISIGRKRMFSWLRENGYLQKDNKPYQRYIDNGFFALRESSITTIKGNLLRSTTLITGKGQMALMARLMEQK